MGATFSRLKNWSPEVLTNTDLNAEIDNILNNLGATGVGSYSASAAQMRLQVDPGEVGSESLATSLAGEIERLRFVIARLIGDDVDYWYESPPSSITDIVEAVGTGLAENRVASGVTTGNSSQLNALIPNGSAASVQLNGNPTNFIYYINGTQYTISTDVTLTGLGLAPSSNNTCAVDYLGMADEQHTRFLGQYGTIIKVDAMGSEISSRAGTIAGFRTGTEYFIAYIKSSTELVVASRGIFFNSSGARIPSVTLSDNDTITLMRLTWIYANTSGGLVVSYTNPTFSGSEPDAPATGDYWFDMSANTWKIYNSTAWVSANAILIGMTLQDTANCVAARTFDSFKAQSDTNTMTLGWLSNSTVQVQDVSAELSIFGTPQRYGNSRMIWDMASDLDSGLTEASSTYYYFYVKESGVPVISDAPPMYRRDLFGMYHPHETWRCVGYAFNDGSSNLRSDVHTLREPANSLTVMGSPQAYETTAGDSLVYTNYPNQFKRASGGATSWGPSNGEFGDLTTLSLPPGVWRLTATMITAASGALSTATVVNFGISTTSGDSAVGLSPGNLSQAYHTTTSGERHTYDVSNYIVQADVEQTYYLKYAATTVHANLGIVGYNFVAERLTPLLGMPV